MIELCVAHHQLSSYFCSSPSVAYTAGLLSSGWLHFCCCCSCGSSHGTGYLQNAGIFCCNYSFTSILSWALSMWVQSCYTVPSPHDTFTPLELAQPGWFLHYQLPLPTQGTILAVSGTQPVCVCLLSGNTFQKTSPLRCRSLVVTANFSTPGGQHWVSQQSKGLT